MAKKTKKIAKKSGILFDGKQYIIGINETITSLYFSDLSR